jgi:hypothetical protein
MTEPAYKLAHIDKTQVVLAARKALMVADPHYFAYQHPSWVRLLIHEQFYYATFLSLATYLLDEIESAVDNYINQLIPHDYVDGKNHGNREKGGFLWDMKIDAGGLEDLTKID